jgi:8-oxo-dGTP pyrophosphatase MutT (NUDIX family)
MIVKPIPRNIHVTVERESFLLLNSLQESINEFWELLIKENPYLTRGEIFSIKNMSWSEEELNITLQKTDYAHFLFSQQLNSDNKYKCRSVVANGVILTSDGYFVIGEMNTFTSAPGRLQFVAGGIDSSDLQGNVVNMFESLSRESQEEIGIDLADSKLVSKVTPKYIVEWKAISLVYLVELSIDSQQMKLHYNDFENGLISKGITPEFSSIIFVPTNQVLTFLNNDPRSKLEFLPKVLVEISKDINTEHGYQDKTCALRNDFPG